MPAFWNRLTSSLFHVCRRMERALCPPELLGRSSTGCPLVPMMPLGSVGPPASRPSSNTRSSNWNRIKGPTKEVRFTELLYDPTLWLRYEQVEWGLAGNKRECCSVYYQSSWICGRRADWVDLSCHIMNFSGENGQVFGQVLAYPDEKTTM